MLEVEPTTSKTMIIDHSQRACYFAQRTANDSRQVIIENWTIGDSVSLLRPYDYHQDRQPNNPATENLLR